MNTLVLSERDVHALLPMNECIEVVARALEVASRGDVVLPLRSKMSIPGTGGLLGLMPAYLGEPRCFGIKVVSVMPGNHGTAYDAHQGSVLLFEAEHGCLIALLDASSITAIRTAAASGVATRALARDDAGDLAIIGSGIQASSHLSAMKEVRTLRRVRVHSRNEAHARTFAEREGRRHGMEIEVARDARSAVEGSDLICTTTSSKTPVLEGSCISAGAHINAVGACIPTARELDSEAMRRSSLFTDRRESLLHEAGDFIIARDEGALSEEHVRGEVGDVLLGRHPGRRSREEITLFESLGVGIEDLAAAHHVITRARAGGQGVSLVLGGTRDGHV